MIIRYLSFLLRVMIGDPGPAWVENSLSFFNGNCVEVADLSGRTIDLRDSKEGLGSSTTVGGRRRGPRSALVGVPHPRWAGSLEHGVSA
jgi:hypothetical protein